MQAEPLTVEDVIQTAIAQADRAVEDAIRITQTRMLTAVDGEPDVDAIDDQIAAIRAAWATQRATLPDVIARAVANRAATGPRS
jgi:hypothetical protein